MSSPSQSALPVDTQPTIHIEDASDTDSSQSDSAINDEGSTQSGDLLTQDSITDAQSTHSGVPERTNGIGRRPSLQASAASFFSLSRRHNVHRSMDRNTQVSGSQNLRGAKSKMSLYNSIQALSAWLSEPVPGIDQQVDSENGNQEPTLAANNNADQVDMEMQEDVPRLQEYNHKPTLATVPSADSQTALLNHQPHLDLAYQHRLSKIISSSGDELPEPTPPIQPSKQTEKAAPQSPLPLAKIIRTAEMAGQRDPRAVDSNGTLETGAATPSPPTSPHTSLIKKADYTRRRSSLRPHQPSHTPAQQPDHTVKAQSSHPTKEAHPTNPSPTRRIFSSTASRRASWHPGLPALPTDAPSVRSILKNYLQSFLISIIIGLPCNALVYGLSLLGWRWGDDLVKWKADQPAPGGTLQKDTMMSPTAFTVICTIMFTGALPIFNAVQFMAIHSWKAFRKTGLIWAAPLSCLFAAGSLWGLWYSGWPFWFYYIDVVIILLSYISCTFLSGYYGRRGTVPRLERLFDAIEFGIIECFVSVAAVFYGLWIMPIFSWIPDGYKMYWRFTVHPVYWELFVKFATRRLLIAKAGTELNAIDTLSLAHAQAHITVMQVSIVAGLESFESLFVAVFVFGALRFVIRSLASYEYHFRRFIVDKLWPFRVGGRLNVDPVTELEIEKYMMAIDIQTEVVQENAAVLFASTLAYLFYRYGDLFSMTMPEDDTFGVSHAVATVFIQLGVNAFFDLAGLWFNSRWASRLPFQRTWREMWGVGVRFFGFQVYAMFTMGLSAQIYFMARLPRGGLCDDPFDTCSCKFLNAMAKEMCAGDTHLAHLNDTMHG